MPNLVALGHMASGKNSFKDFYFFFFFIFFLFFFFSVLLPWEPEFLKESNSFKNSEEDHARNLPLIFIKIGLVVSEKEMF